MRFYFVNIYLSSDSKGISLTYQTKSQNLIINTLPLEALLQFFLPNKLKILLLNIYHDFIIINFNLYYAF